MDDAAMREYVNSILGATGATTSTPIIGAGTTSTSIRISGAPNIATIGTGLSVQEMQELGELEIERKKLLKQKRIQIFKDAPASFRQFIIDAVRINEFIDNLNNASIDDLELTNRIADLKSRDCRIHLGGLQPGNNSYFWEIACLLQLISEQELIEAHAAQTLEEALLASTDSINKHE